jgi:hypothetical protein
MPDSSDTLKKREDAVSSEPKNPQEKVANQIISLCETSLFYGGDISADRPDPKGAFTQAEERFLGIVSSLLTPNPPADNEDEVAPSFRLNALKQNLIKIIVLEQGQDSEESRARCAIRPDVIIAAMLVAKLRAVDPALNSAERTYAKDVNTLLDHIVGYSIANQPTLESQSDKHSDYSSLQNNQMAILVGQLSEEQEGAVDAAGPMYLHPQSLRKDFTVTVRAYGGALNKELDGLKSALSITTNPR